MAKLIVNADDFGYTPYVNRAILQAHHDGIVTSSSVMINLPDAERGLPLALTTAPHLALGLHINLTNGSPVLPAARVPSLVDDEGHFYPIQQIETATTRWQSADLYEEIAAQIERFQVLTGHLPSHLDAHYHMAFLHPFALEATLALANEHHLPLREAMVEQLDTPEGVARLHNFIPYFSEDTFSHLVEDLREVVQRTPRGYFPARFDFRFDDPHNTLGDLLNMLVDAHEAEGVVEIMTHPGFAEDIVVSSGVSRQRELEALCHPATLELVSKLPIVLINFHQI